MNIMNKLSGGPYSNAGVLYTHNPEIGVDFRFRPFRYQTTAIQPTETSIHFNVVYCQNETQFNALLKDWTRQGQRPGFPKWQYDPISA